MHYGRFQGRMPWANHAPPKDDGAAADPPAAAEGEGDDPPAEGGEEEEGEGGPPEGEEGDDSVAAAAGEDPPAGEDGDDDVEDPPATRVPWQKKRLDRVTAQAREAQAEAARLREENATLKALAGRPAGDAEEGADPPAAAAAAPGKRVYTEEEFAAAVRAEATKSSTVSQLNQQVDAVYDGAVALDPKFTERLPALREAVGEQLQGNVSFFKALVKLENGAHVMNALSQDLDRFSEIVEMDPVDMAIELTKIDRKAKARTPAPAPSAASKKHKPIVPVDGPTDPEVTLETAKTAEEYAAIRKKQREARAEARGGWHN